MRPSKYRIRCDTFYCMKIPAHVADLLERVAIRAGAAPCDTWGEKIMVVVNAMRCNRKRRRIHV